MLQRLRLGDDAEEVPGRDGGALFDARLERPRALAVERRQVDAARQQRAPEGVLVVAGQELERTLRAVEDATEQPGTELDFQRPARVEHGLADLQARRVLVDLDRCALAVQADDLTRERGLTDADDVVQPHARRPRATTTGPAIRQISPWSVAAVRRVSWRPRFVTERDLVADGLTEHPKQPRPAVAGLVVRHARR